MNRITACVATAFVATVSFAPRAQATPIRYELTGQASGKIGATPFTDASIDLVGIGDTANVQTFTNMGLTFHANPFSAFSVTIGGIGTATIFDISEILIVPQPVPGFTPLPGILFARTDSPPDLSGITGIGYNLGVPLSGYTGATGIGPITEEGAFGFNPLCSMPGNDPCIHTSLGLLRFSSNPSPPVTTATTFTATTVPEPTTLFLLGGGLVTLVSRRSRARSRK